MNLPPQQLAPLKGLAEKRTQTEFINLKENALIDDRAMQAGLLQLKKG